MFYDNSVVNEYVIFSYRFVVNCMFVFFLFGLFVVLALQFWLLLVWIAWFWLFVFGYLLLVCLFRCFFALELVDRGFYLGNYLWNSGFDLLYLIVLSFGFWVRVWIVGERFWFRLVTIWFGWFDLLCFFVLLILVFVDVF